MSNKPNCFRGNISESCNLETVSYVRYYYHACKPVHRHTNKLRHSASPNVAPEDVLGGSRNSATRSKQQWHLVWCHDFWCGLQVACCHDALPYRTVARWVKPLPGLGSYRVHSTSTTHHPRPGRSTHNVATGSGKTLDVASFGCGCWTVL